MKVPLVEGVDYYAEEGKVVFTAAYHLRRGYCCNSSCRHCPYGNAPSASPRDGASAAADPGRLPPMKRR